MPKGSIRNRILAVFFAALCVLLVFFLPLANDGIRRVLKNNALTFTDQMLRQVNRNIDVYIKEMTHISDFLVRDEAILDGLERSDASVADKAREILATAQGLRPDFTSVALFSDTGRFLSGRPEQSLNPNWDYRDSDWYREAVASAGEIVLSASRVSHVFQGEYPWVVSLSRAIYRDGRFLGVLLIDFNFAQIELLCSQVSLSNGGYVFILGRNGELVYHPLQQLIFSGLKSEPFAALEQAKNGTYEELGGSRIYLAQEAASLGWTVVGVVNVDDIYPMQPLLLAAFLVMLVFFLLVSLAVNASVRHNLYRPLQDLDASIRAFRGGHFGARSRIHVNNEMDHIGETFNAMAARIEALMSDTRRIAEEKRHSDMQTLQAQIRPHFLYNTLESIIWTAELGRKEDVITMTSALSKLLRATNADADQLISLSQEMDYAKHYLSIQKMRYREKLDYRLDLPEALRGARVLQLTLQPLIENALYHGLKPLKEGGRIYVGAWRWDEGLVLCVADNGLGFDLSLVGEDGSLPRSSALSDGGLGLSNVQERIRLYFGPEFGLSFISRGRRYSRLSEAAFAACLAAGPGPGAELETRILIHLPYLNDGEAHRPEGGQGR